jgi:putrescine transport system permease protein
MLRLIPFAWLLAFVAAPCLLLLAIAFAAGGEGVPPFTWPFGPEGWRGSFEAWATLTADDYYLAAFLRSLRVAFLTAGFCLLLGYPMALAIARAPARRQPLLLGAVLLPFWTGFLLRVAAWIGLLRDEGWLNHVLLAVDVIEEPLPLLYSQFSMLLGLVHSYLPFAVLPLYATLLRLDRGLEEAAADLGASPATVFRTVTLPLIAPALAAAWLLAFTLSLDDVVVAGFVSGPAGTTLPMVLFSRLHRGWTPEVNALGVAILALAGLAGGLALAMLNRSARPSGDAG